MIDIATLTLGEVAKIEDLTGLPMTRLGDDDAPKGAMLAAMAFITKRRQDMTFTWNQAQELTLEAANEILGLADDEDDSAPKE